MTSTDKTSEKTVQLADNISQLTLDEQLAIFRILEEKLGENASRKVTIDADEAEQGAKTES